MNTKVLEYIIAIAEERSISRAAERFYLSYPALSAHLKKIETEMGTPLFLRTPNGMEPTAAGLVFLADARAILHQEKSLELALASMRRQQQRMIRVMVDAAFYNRFVQRVMPRFSELQPQYAVDIAKCNASEAISALLKGNATMAAIISAALQSQGLVYLPFYTSKLRLFFSGDYRGRTDIDGLEQALNSGMYMCLYPSGSTARTMIQQRLAHLQIYPQRIIEGESRTILDHVAAGNACCILPEFFQPRTEQLGLITGDAFSPLNHVLAYPAQAALSPAVQQMMQIIIEVYSSFEKG